MISGKKKKTKQQQQHPAFCFVQSIKYLACYDLCS